MQQITLTLSVEATNLILGALAQRPYAEVHTLIQDIQQQAYPQLEAIKTAHEENGQPIQQPVKK